MSDQESKIKELEKEVEVLRKKLEDRNPAFNGNLLRKSGDEFRRLQIAIGEAIRQCVGQDLLYAFKNRPMRLDYDSSTYGGKGWNVSFSEKDQREICDAIADQQMKRFQDSLDNFAWAVQNR